MRKLLAAGIVIGAASMLVGCIPYADTLEDDVDRYVAPITVTLDSGREVECVAMVGSSMGSIECDFGGSR